MEYLDPMTKVNTPPETPSPEGVVGCSWLGQFKVNGWSIRIEPALSESEWELLRELADTRAWLQWADGEGEYNVGRAYDMLRSLFPEHTLLPHRPRPEGQ